MSFFVTAILNIIKNLTTVENRLSHYLRSIMLKTIGLLLALLLPTSIFATGLPHFSNMIIFGDSLSDIGNFPESRWVIAPKQKIYMNNLYIPVSNPVNQSHSHRYHVINTHFSALYPKPQTLYKSEQPPINGIKRQWHSIGWSQYLLELARLNKLTTSPAIIASKYLHQLSKEQRQHLSVNYAWFGAMSTPQCNNNNQNHASQCNRRQVWQSAQQYRQGQTMSLKEAVKIPGIDQQINFFLADKKAGRINTNNKTLFIVWSGANDLGQAFHRLLSGQLSTKQFLRSVATTVPNRVSVDVKKLITQAQAKQVVIFNQFNLGSTPEALANLGAHTLMSRYFAAAGLNLLIMLYNHELNKRLALLKKQYPQIKIGLYNTSRILNNLITLKWLRSGIWLGTLGQRCQLSSPCYSTAQASPKNCAGYMFWNSAHPSSGTQQVIAYYLLSKIKWLH